MLDVEFLTETKQLKPVILYEYESTIFKPMVDKKILDSAKAKGLEPVVLNHDDPAMHLNEPSLFGERYFLIDLSLYLKGPHKEAMVSLLHAMAEKVLTFKGYMYGPKEATDAYGELPAFAAVRKLSTHIEATSPTKNSLKKILALYTQEEDASLAAVSNFDLLEKALQQVASQDDMNIEVFYKKLDLMKCLCIDDQGQFDSMAFHRYIMGNQTEVNYYKFHELVYSLCSAQPDTSEHPTQQLITEVDVQLSRHGQEPRQIMAKLLFAIRDLLLVNATIGGATDQSEHITKYKRQVLSKYAQINPMRLTRLQALLMVEETRYRNSNNLAVDFHTHLCPRFFEPIPTK